MNFKNTYNSNLTIFMPSKYEFDENTEIFNLLNIKSSMNDDLHNMMELQSKYSSVSCNVEFTDKASTSNDIKLLITEDEIRVIKPTAYQNSNFEGLFKTYYSVYHIQMNKIEQILENRESEVFLSDIESNYIRYINSYNEKLNKVYNKIIDKDNVVVFTANGSKEFIPICAIDYEIYSQIRIGYKDGDYIIITIKDNIISKVWRNGTTFYSNEHYVIDFTNIKCIFGLIDEFINEVENFDKIKIIEAIEMLQNNPDHIAFESDYNHQVKLNIVKGDERIELTDVEIIELINKKLDNIIDKI